MPLSGVAPFYYGFVVGLDGGQLERVVLELLGLECRFLSLVCLECWLVGRWRVLSVGLAESPITRSPWSYLDNFSNGLHREFIQHAGNVDAARADLYTGKINMVIVGTRVNKVNKLGGGTRV